MIQLIRSIQQLKTRKMAQYGLKGTNAVCLCQLLKSEEGLSATELSVEAEIDKAQVSRCVSELMSRGFVYRDDREGRRYKQKYRLTEEGTPVATDISKELDRIQRAVEKDVPTEELATFFDTLQKLCKNFEELLQ
jgi:predicted transcriptional regulator